MTKRITGDGLPASRELAVRLIRHGTALNSRSHYLWIARASQPDLPTMLLTLMNVSEHLAYLPMLDMVVRSEERNIS